MNKVIIIADSTCDLSTDLVEKNNIVIVPLHVSFENDSTDYLDGVNIDALGVYEKVEKIGKTPKTGAINQMEFLSIFKKYIDRGYDIIFIGIGSGLSSTYDNALVAAKELPEGRIEIVDSQNLSTGTGLLVLKMAKLRDEGKNVHEIAEEVRKLVPHVSAKFCIDKLDYLYKGGRCSGLSRLFAHVLHIHPICKMIENKLVVYKMPRGKYIKAVDEQIEEFVHDLPNMDTSCVFVTDSQRMEGESEYIIDKLSKYIDKKNIYNTHAGCVVSSHCGPKTVGILYILKK